MNHTKKIALSQKVANLFEQKVIENVLYHHGEVLDLEDDSHAYLFEEIYQEAGIRSRLPVWKRGENYEVKRVKQYLVKHIKKGAKPYISRGFVRSFDYTTTIFSLCDENKRNIKFEDIDADIIKEVKSNHHH